MPKDSASLIEKSNAARGPDGIVVPSQRHYTSFYSSRKNQMQGPSAEIARVREHEPKSPTAQLCPDYRLYMYRTKPPVAAVEYTVHLQNMTRIMYSYARGPLYRYSTLTALHYTFLYSSKLLQLRDEPIDILDLATTLSWGGLCNIISNQFQMIRLCRRTRHKTNRNAG
jgi:hypothetical protein